MPEKYMKDSLTVEKKTLSISSKRQITIPQNYFTKLGFSSEAECILHGNELIIRPIKTSSGGEFAEQILADLIAQGYSGDELLSKFKETQRNIRPAVEAMLTEAKQAAENKGSYSTYDDFFAN